MSVVSCGTGETGLEEFEKNDFDAVLLDWKMPGMEGFEALQRIRELDKWVPVIVVTSFSSIPGAVKFMQDGATHYLPKPLMSTGLLAHYIEECIENQEGKYQQYSDDVSEELDFREGLKGIVAAKEAKNEKLEKEEAKRLKREHKTRFDWYTHIEFVRGLFGDDKRADQLSKKEMDLVADNMNISYEALQRIRKKYQDLPDNEGN